MSEGGSNPWWVVLGSGAISGAFLAINNWLNARGGWKSTDAAREREREEKEERTRQKVLDSLDARQARFVQQMEADRAEQVRRREAAEARADREERAKDHWRWVAVERGYHLREAKQIAESAIRLLPPDMPNRLGPLPPWWRQWIKDPEEGRSDHGGPPFLDNGHTGAIEMGQDPQQDTGGA